MCIGKIAFSLRWAQSFVPIGRARPTVCIYRSPLGLQNALLFGGYHATAEAAAAPNLRSDRLANVALYIIAGPNCLSINFVSPLSTLVLSEGILQFRMLENLEVPNGMPFITSQISHWFKIT